MDGVGSGEDRLLQPRASEQHIKDGKAGFQ